MKVQEYEILKKQILTDSDSNTLHIFQWELLKALWDIARALHKGLAD